MIFHHQGTKAPRVLGLILIFVGVLMMLYGLSGCAYRRYDRQPSRLEQWAYNHEARKATGLSRGDVRHHQDTKAPSGAEGFNAEGACGKHQSIL